MKHGKLSVCLVVAATACTQQDTSGEGDLDQAQAAIAAGTVYKVTLPKMSGDAGNCVNVAGSSLDNGARIQEWDCNGTTAQQFVPELGTSPYYRFKNPTSGKCLNIYSGAIDATHSVSGNVNGAAIQQWTCGTGDNNYWELVSYNGGYQFKSKLTTGDGARRCLDVTGGDTHTANGTNIELWSCGSTGTLKGNQTFNPVAAGGGGTGGTGGTSGTGGTGGTSGTGGTGGTSGTGGTGGTSGTGGTGGTSGTSGTGGTGPGNFPARFSAPYVPTWNDTNLANLSSSTGNKFWTLAFIIPPSSGGGCTPTWNGDTSLTGTNYGSYISSLRAAGGDVIVSFGGEAGGELGKACTTVSTLQAAYQKVIDQFKLTWLDLDIESGLENDTTSIDRRNKALHNLQVANPGLRVDYTLAVERNGLPTAQQNLLSNAKANGVTVSNVNIMAMDYGICYTDMGQAAIDAASNTKNQLANLGISAKVGVTPMIGTNDDKCEVFSTSDASALVNYAQANSYIGLLAYWEQTADPTHAYINIFKTFH